MLLARAEMAAVLHACMYVRATLAHLSVPFLLYWWLLYIYLHTPIYIYIYMCVYI